jgi:type II secretory pathway component GspD/PulD (secretin)
MKRCAFSVVFFCMMCTASAEAINVTFNDIPANEFAYFVLNDLKKESFFMDNEFLALESRFTIRLFDVDSDFVFEHLKSVLSSIGFTLLTNNGMHSIVKSTPSDDREVFVYFPKYRSADYLRELAGQLVDVSGFTVNRVISDSSGFNPLKSATASVNDLISRKSSDVIVYYGSSSDIQKLELLFSRIDRSVGEVLIKSVIYEVRRESVDNNAVSIALGLLDSLKGVGTRITAGVIDSGNLLRLRVSNADIAFSLLSEDSRFSQISAPTVRIRSGDTARFQAGAEVPTLGSVTTNGNGQSVQSIDYRSSGVILELVPEIHGVDIDLSITHQLSSFTNTTTGVNSSPTLLKRELKTSVTVEDGEILMIGGLEEKTENISKKGFPFLPEIFKGSSDSGGMTEILLLLHVKRIQVSP